jgi:hypothetical protein
MPKLEPEFAVIRDNPNLTEDEKIKALLEVLKSRSPSPPISLDQLGMDSHGDGTMFIVRKNKDGQLQPIAYEPEMSRKVLMRAFLHPDTED